MKPVSKTAFYCCAVRALDATASPSACGDGYADRFMTPEAWSVFEPFRGLHAPNASNVARHRMIDDLLRAELVRRPEAGVVIIGAGFDTRAFRLPGGRWVEVDEPALIALKEAQLPALEAPNPLARVAVAFDREPLDAVLAPFRDLAAPMIILEGVLTYLSVGEVEALLRAIRGTFVKATLICDMTTTSFIRRYAGGIGNRLKELGAPYGRLGREPRGLIEAAGFRLVTSDSVVGRAAELGLLRIPRWLLATLFRTLRDGYTIATFESV